MESEILVERRGPIGIVTLNRPEALNSVTPDMCELLIHECGALNDDPEIRVIVLTGAGKGFCAGLDLKKNTMSDPRRRSPYRMMHFEEHPFARLRRMAIPIVAAVNGVAVGAGLGISLACDIRIMSENARFGAGFIKMAMPPQDIIGYYLPQIVGLAKSLEIVLTGRMVGAAEAKDIGLVMETVAPDALMDRALEIAGQIAEGPPMALAMAKQVIYRSFNKPIDDALAWQNLGTFLNTSYAKHDVDEAVASFMEKRTATFRGP